MADLKMISLSNIEFGLDLYGQLSAAQPDSNLFYSPISISIALAMTYLGANGKTKDEMKAALKFDKLSEDNLHLHFKELSDHLLDTKGKYQLHIANKLFGEQSYTFLQEFLQSCTKFYGAGLQTVDFRNDAGGCESQINEWVEQQTNKKIKDLMPPGVLNSLTRLVLVNAIYFKGDWHEKFDAQHTKEEDFFVSKTETIKVPLMHFSKKKLNYRFNEQLSCQVLELPYIGKTLSFIVILPDLAKTTLSDVEKKLTGENLSNITKNLRSVDVKLWLPKFKLESRFEVDKVLEKLGIVDLFVEGEADLSKMDGTRELYVSKVLHKAYVEVNEEGSEAAAATGVVVMTRCAVINFDPEVVRVDHPFIFLIRENETGAVLFMGKMVKP